MSLMLTKEDLAKYPFLKQSIAYIESMQLNLGDLAAEEYSGILRKALTRIKDSIDRKINPADLSDLESEIISYPLSLALVYGSKSNWLLNRFATIEAKRVEEELRREPRDKLLEIAKSGFSWEIEPVDLRLEWEELPFSIPLQSYLEAATSFNDPHWKLINRYVKAGASSSIPEALPGSFPRASRPRSSGGLPRGSCTISGFPKHSRLTLMRYRGMRKRTCSLMMSCPRAL